MKAVNWADVVTDSNKKEYEVINPGGYICQIVDVIDNEEYESLKIVMDIAEGEHANYGERVSNATGYNYGYLKTSRNYSEGWEESFKAFLLTLENSNRRFFADKFNNDPETLKGLRIGVIVGQEEYAGKNGDGVYVKKLRPRVFALTTVKKIDNGDFKVPDKPKEMSEYYANLLTGNTGETTTEKADVDLPF